MSEKKNTLQLHPFTNEQNKFMEEHYGLFQWFLSFKWMGNAKNSLCVSKPFPMLDRDDIYDSALNGYMRAVQQYDECAKLRKYSFATIAVNAMRWELLRLLAKETRRMSFMNMDISSFDGALRKISETPVLGEQIEQAEANDLWNQTVTIITERQGNILRLRLFGHTYREIAKKSGMGIKQIDNCLYRTRKKLRGQLVA